MRKRGLCNITTCVNILFLNVAMTGIIADIQVGKLVKEKNKNKPYYQRDVKGKQRRF